jgi:4-carboxymuconolactone decarboxylase
LSARLPALKPADLDKEQRKLYDSLVENEVPWANSSSVRAMAQDGSLLGPFNPLLFNPVLGAAQIEVFRADKKSTSLTPRVHEIIILQLELLGTLNMSFMHIVRLQRTSDYQTL